ncbi:hypothetical protein NMY22_g15 [Coprinellus aureogranulatus]|nr:hypothetical protein NMY22_g15 [Coprinellus aureogranulatus]
MSSFTQKELDGMELSLAMERIYGSAKIILVSPAIQTTRLHPDGAPKLYYYATTFDEEVTNIWPQPGLKLGKLLFIGMRYSNIIAFILDYFFNTSNHLTMSVKSCQAIFEANWVFSTIGGSLAQVNSYVLALPLRSAVGEASATLDSNSHIHVIGYISMNSEKCKHSPRATTNLPTSDISNAPNSDIPVVPIDVQFGYPCSYTLKYVDRSLHSVASYLVAARAFLVLVASIAILYKRYHSRRFNSILGIMQREGGTYLFAQAVINVIAGLKDTKSAMIPDKYGIVSACVLRHLLFYSRAVTDPDPSNNRIRSAILPIFADRLLLKMLRIVDPDDTTVASTIMFNRMKDPEVTGDGYMMGDKTKRKLHVLNSTVDSQDSVRA